MQKNMIKSTALALSLAAAVTAAAPAAPVHAAVKLNKTSATVYAWKTVTLKLKGTSKSIKWSSNKKSVATVNTKGKVTAKKAGKAVISAKAGKKTYKCRVTVKNPYLSETSAVLEKGQSLKLKLTGASVSQFRSGSSKVASVSSKGTVKAKSAGTAVISVTDTKGRVYKCTVTVPADENDPGSTQPPVAEPEQPAQHVHAFIYPVLSADGLSVTEYACPCSESTGHACVYTEPVYETAGPYAGIYVKGRKCSCGNEISSENYDTLIKTLEKTSQDIRSAWIKKNLTAGMTDVQKIHKIAEEMHSWAYKAVPHMPVNIVRSTLCAGGNKAFVEYCAAAGIRAELVDVSGMTGIKDHYMAYVWVNGKKCITDATPGGGFTGPSIWTMDGFDLYCDYLDGYVTDEEFDKQIKQYEM